MDSKQRRRMAYQTIVQEADARSCAGDTEYTIQVSGNQVEIHQSEEMPWDNEHGTGKDYQQETLIMSLDTLKKLIRAAQWCIEKSEAFEKKYPAETMPDPPAYKPLVNRLFDPLLESSEAITEDDQAYYRRVHGE